MDPLGRPEYLRQQVELSLRRLGVERIDLFQLHRIDPNVPLAEQLGALKQLQAEGKIRHIGLSEVTVEQLKEAQKIAEIASVQNLYNLANREAEDVLSTARRRTSRSSRGSRSRPASWPSHGGPLAGVGQGARRNTVAAGAGLAAARVPR